MVEQHTLSYIRDGVYLNGNRVSDSFLLKGPDSNAPCWWNACLATWSYDARERLIQEIPGTGSTRALALDVQGNVTQESAGSSITRTYSGQQLQTQTAGGVLTRYLYDALGSLDCQVKSAHTGTICPAGGNTNLIEDNVYDHKSRLIGYRYYNGAPTASKRSDYTNDPLDRPVKQVETISGTTTTYDFTYIGVTNALSKEVLSGGTWATKKYAYDAFGNRATISEDKPGDTTKRYSYLYDPHSSVSLLIDQNNVVKESYGYAAYGAANAALTRTASGFDNKTNPYRYTGKRLDSGSGTYDMGARRYSASTGRFLQYDVFSDALEDLGLSEDPLTQNRYAFAGGNPVTFVEIDGHVFGFGEAWEFLKEVSGYNDFQECLDGEWTSCGWAIVGVTPVGKVGKVGKAGKVALKGRKSVRPTLWAGGAAERGRRIENALGATIGRKEGWGDNLDRLCGPRCNNFPVADFWNKETGLLTSVKSINSKNPAYLKRKILASAKGLANAPDLSRGFGEVLAKDVKARQLVVALPAGQRFSPSVRSAIRQARKAAPGGLKVRFVFVR